MRERVSVLQGLVFENIEDRIEQVFAYLVGDWDPAMHWDRTTPANSGSEHHIGSSQDWDEFMTDDEAWWIYSLRAVWSMMLHDEQQNILDKVSAEYLDREWLEIGLPPEAEVSLYGDSEEQGVFLIVTVADDVVVAGDIRKVDRRTWVASGSGSTSVGGICVEPVQNGLLVGYFGRRWVVQR